MVEEEHMACVGREVVVDLRSKKKKKKKKVAVETIRKREKGTKRR
jgi:hypothetical protein